MCKSISTARANRSTPRAAFAPAASHVVHARSRRSWPLTTKDRQETRDREPPHPRSSVSSLCLFPYLRITTSAVPARINPHPMIIKIVTISPRNSPAQIIVKAGIKNVTVSDFVGPMSAIKRK